MHQQLSLLLILAFLFPKLIVAQNATSRSTLQSNLANATVDSNKVELILNIYRTYNLDQIDSIVLIAKKGIQIAASNLNTSWGKRYYQKFISDIGHLYRQERNFAASKALFRKQIERGISINDSSLISHGYSDLAYVYADEEKPDSTIIYDLKALEIRKKTGSKKVGASYNNLGYDYKIQENFDKALVYYLKAVDYKEKYDSSKGIGNSYMNVGNIYQKMNLTDSSLYYFNLALDNSIAIKDSIFMAEVLHSIGSTHTSPLLSKEYLSKAMDILKLLKREKHPRFANTYQELAIVHMKLNELETAENLLLESEEILLNSARENSDRMARNFEIIERLYVLKKDFEKAYLYARKERTLTDTLYKIALEQNAAELLVKYEDQLKEQRIQSLEQKQQISDLENEKLNRNFQFLLIASIVLVLIIGFLYRINKWRSKVNLELETLNNTKDKLFSIIAHDLKNPLSAFRSITQSLSDDIFDISREDLDYFIKQLNNSAHNLFDLLQNLLYWSISQSGRLDFQPQKVILNHTTTEVFNLLESSANIKKIALQNNIPEEHSVWADPKMTHTVLRNLVANAIKFTSNGGNISTYSVIKHSKLNVFVKDTGNGMSPEIAKNLFILGSSNATARNEVEGKGTGLGLILCKELIERQGGKIWLENTSPQGSTFGFTLPIPSQKNEL